MTIFNRKRPLLLIIFAITVCMLANCGGNELADGHFYREGRFLPCVNGSSIIIVDDYGPITMTPENDSITFDGLTVGDKIKIEVYLIEETYPANAVIYAIEKLSDGELADIDSDLLERLYEMGRYCADYVPPSAQAD